MALRYVALRAVGIAELALARSRAGAHHANAVIKPHPVPLLVT